jgi:hypothetical protein
MLATPARRDSPNPSPGFHKQIGKQGLQHICRDEQKQRHKVTFAIGKEQIAGSQAIDDLIHPDDPD